MDTYDDYRFPKPVQPEYAGKKRSPFSNSDYVTPFDAMPVSEVQPAAEKTCRKKRTGVTAALSVLLVAVLIASCCTVTAVIVDRYWQEEINLLNQVMDNRLSVLQKKIDSINVGGTGGAVPPSGEGVLTPGQVYGQNVSAVVAVSCKCVTTNMFGQATETSSTGSGFLITQDGYVVSNYHVVQDAQTLSVVAYEGKTYEAKLVGYDAANDISVLKIEGENFPFVTFGSSDALIVGDQVTAVGNALGELNATLTVGYVSAKDRIVTTDGTTMNMLQTDAAINSGNSGGPLFNMQGQVVGITTAKYSGTTTSGASIEGIGFAIPIDDVAGMIWDLKEYGYITGAYMGVSISDVAQSAQQYGVPAGAYVQSVEPGSAAQRSGVKKGDIIVNLGGYDVTSVTELSRALRNFKAGDTTTVTVYRSGQRVNMSITLAEKPR